MGRTGSGVDAAARGFVTLHFYCSWEHLPNPQSTLYVRHMLGDTDSPACTCRAPLYIIYCYTTAYRPPIHAVCWADRQHWLYPCLPRAVTDHHCMVHSSIYHCRRSIRFLYPGLLMNGYFLPNPEHVDGLMLLVFGMCMSWDGDAPNFWFWDCIILDVLA